VPLEARLRKQFGTKECRVTLHNILSSVFKGSYKESVDYFVVFTFIHPLFIYFFLVVNAGNGELLPSNEADQTEDGSCNKF